MRERRVGGPLPARSPSAPRQAQPGARTLAAHVLAEPEELRRTAAGRGGEAARALDEPALLDEPAEVLLVEPQPDQRLDGTLQLRQRERRRQELEDDRAVRQLAAQPAERARRNAPVVVSERHTGAEIVRRLLALVRVMLDDQYRLVHQLVSLEHADRIPRHRRHAARLADPRLPGLAAARPALELRHHLRLERIGPAVAVVLPREEIVVIDPRGARRRLLLAHEREICDREEPRVDVGPAVAIAERVELLDVAELEPGPVLDPAPKSPLERHVGVRVERTRRDRRPPRVLQRDEQPRSLFRHRDDHGLEAQRDHRSRTLRHLSIVLPHRDRRGSGVRAVLARSRGHRWGQSPFAQSRRGVAESSPNPSLAWTEKKAPTPHRPGPSTGPNRRAGLSPASASASRAARAG